MSRLIFFWAKHLVVSHVIFKHVVTIRSVARFKLPRNLFQVFRRLQIYNPANLACVAHQLLGAGIQHPHPRIARNGKIVQHDVWNGDPAVGLYVIRSGSTEENGRLPCIFDRGTTYHGQRVAEEDESGGVVGEVVSNFVEGCVDSLVIILTDLVCIFIDHIWSAKEGH